MSHSAVQPKFRHVCEACRTEAILTAEEGFNAGWDYPPRMGAFGVMSPRTCPACPINRTLWWKLTVTKDNNLTAWESEVLARIQAEPESILVS